VLRRDRQATATNRPAMVRVTLLTFLAIYVVQADPTRLALAATVASPTPSAAILVCRADLGLAVAHVLQGGSDSGYGGNNQGEQS
jgi:hypothetical protein